VAEDVAITVSVLLPRGMNHDACVCVHQSLWPSRANGFLAFVRSHSCRLPSLTVLLLFFRPFPAGRPFVLPDWLAGALKMSVVIMSLRPESLGMPLMCVSRQVTG
jgi:hypothetical protein